MRPLELSLVLINLLTLGVFAVPQLHAVRWTGYGVLIAIVQIIVEGPRWQMVPAYVLTGLFFLVWLLQRTTRWSVGRSIDWPPVWLSDSRLWCW